MQFNTVLLDILVGSYYFLNSFVHHQSQLKTDLNKYTCSEKHRPEHLSHQKAELFSNKGNAIFLYVW